MFVVISSGFAPRAFAKLRQSAVAVREIYVFFARAEHFHLTKPVAAVRVPLSRDFFLRRVWISVLRVRQGWLLSGRQGVMFSVLLNL
jgi:hypothetical protein